MIKVFAFIIALLIVFGLFPVLIMGAAALLGVFLTYFQAFFVFVIISIIYQLQKKSV